MKKGCINCKHWNYFDAFCLKERMRTKFEYICEDYEFELIISRKKAKSLYKSWKRITDAFSKGGHVSFTWMRGA